MPNVLLRNYWILHGNFTGFEKTGVIDTIPDNVNNKMTYCYGSIGFSSEEDFMTAIEKNKREFTLAKLDNDMKRAVLLITNTILNTEEYSITIENERLTIGDLFFRTTLKKTADVQAIMHKICSCIEVQNGDSDIVAGNVIFVKANVKKAVEFTEKFLVNLYKKIAHLHVIKEYLVLQLLGIAPKEQLDDKQISNLFLFAARNSITVAELLRLFDITMPDLLACKEHNDDLFIIIDENEVYTFDCYCENIHAYNLMNFMALYNYKRTTCSDNAGLHNIQSFG